VLLLTSENFSEMAGRNDQAIANALIAVAQAVQGNQNQQGGNDERRLDRFMKQEPPKFDGGHKPDDAYKWLQEIERIFRVMEATEAQKVMMATHRLTDEADFWWGNTRQRMIAAGTLMTWNNFRTEFLAKYFPADVMTKKEIEFLKLEQGSMTVAEYARKFEELSRFCPHIKQQEQKVLSVSSLSAVCAQISRRLSVIRRFGIFLRWSTKEEFMKRTPRLVRITIRLEETREIMGKTVASHTRFKEVIEETNRRTTPGKRKVGEEILTLLIVSDVVAPNTR
jgi:hypothetical protein